MKRSRPTSGEFFSALRRRRAGNASAIDRELDRRAGEELAIFILDSAGFTRRTHEQGIFQFLSVMTRAFDRMEKVIRQSSGTVLSRQADNMVAIFEDPARAVRAAVAAHRMIRSGNADKPSAERFNVCIGIDYGRVLRLRDNVYGAAVNVASKLGEDLAEKDEILVTGEVARRVLGRVRCVYTRSTEIGGRTFELYRVRY